MKTKVKRFLVTQQPEWDDAFDRLKRDMFYDKSKAEMIRFLISKGIESVKPSASEQKPA